MKLWLVQMQSKLADKRANLDKILNYVGQAVDNNVDLIAFPELALTGYGCRERFYDLAEPISGPAVAEVAASVKGSGLYVILGLPELDGLYLYNSAVVIGAQGVTATYRKLFLATAWSPAAVFDEGMFFRPGSEIAAPELACCRIGVEICRDINYPEITRAQAYLGALLLTCISAAPKTTVGDLALHERFQLLGRARAVENCAWYAYVNQAGKDEDGNDYGGGSFIANHRGNVVQSASSGENAREEVIAHDIDIEQLTQSRIIYPHLREARPDVLKAEIKAARGL